MSRTKLIHSQESSFSALRWQQAIVDAEELLAKTQDLARKRGLELAIKLFKVRLADGASYPS